MKNTWQQSGNNFSLREVSTQIGKLPKAVYVVRFAPMMGFFLEKMANEFPVPEKVYGLTSGFIERVQKTFSATKGNLGVLLNGIRGTGKTVTCELISNLSDLPTLIVDTNYDGLGDFLAEIQQDIILFFDEFEKVFPRDYGSPSKLLMVMDGVMKGHHRKLFLLTTNELSIDPNMIQRPGRIRYVKTFSNLTPEVITEIVNDKLHNKSFAKQVIEFISELELITIDIVTSIIEEVNIHMEAPDAFMDVFNVKKLNEVYAVFEYNKDPQSGKTVENLYKPIAKIAPKIIDENHGIGYNFIIDRDLIGEIVEVENDGTFIVQPNDEYDEPTDKYIKPPARKFRIEPRYSLNPVFKGHAGSLAFGYAFD